MFKMSAFSVDAGRQMTPPLVDGMAHNRLVQFAPHGDQTLEQLVDILVINKWMHVLFCTFFRFRHCKNYWNRLRFDRVAVKCTLLRFMNHGENVGFNFST